MQVGISHLHLRKLMKLDLKLILSSIRILLGIFFIISAITKIVSIDSFEIFIYSFGYLKLNTAFLFARFLIAIEFFIGLLLITGIYLSLVIKASIVLLSVFSIFIAYMMIGRSNAHCHCFGDVFELSNITSLIKNIIIIVLLLLIRKSSKLVNKYQTVITSVFFILSFAIPFILSPPDSFYLTRYSGKVTYNDVLLDKFLKDNKEYSSGKKVLCFYSTNCKFCRLAAQKISVIAGKTNKFELINCIFWTPNKSVNDFYSETNTYKFKYKTLQPDLFLRITNGEMPAILLLQDGKVKAKYGYRSINESELTHFLLN